MAVVILSKPTDMTQFTDSGAGTVASNGVIPPNPFSDFWITKTGMVLSDTEKEQSTIRQNLFY